MATNRVNPANTITQAGYPLDYSSSSGGSAATPQGLSFAFEQVAAILTPFDMVAPSSTGSSSQNLSRTSRPLGPILDTQGLVFPYNPQIGETISVKYEQMNVTHSNEAYYAYSSTENVQIVLSDCTWTCDTFENAVYALAALHFLRSYSYMDFGRNRSGKPPSPMWFRAYGNYAYYKVPVLLQRASFSFPSDIDYVGIPEPGSPEYVNKQLNYTRSSSDSYTWMPVVFKADNINLIVQHAPSYWTGWNLDDYKSGAMLRSRKSFHAMGN